MKSTLHSPSKHPKPNIPSDQIYKAHILDSEGKRKAIIVFSRGVDVPILYDGSEVDDIHFSDFQIHLDDSIRVIKKKILFELWNSHNKCSYEELYLFGKTNDALPLESSTNPRRRDFRIGADTENDSANPYSVKSDEILPNISKRVLFENRLLLNHVPLYQNDIYVCFAEDVLEHFRKSNQENADTYAIRTYFPLLQVETYSELIAKRSSLLKDTRDLLDENTEQSYRTVQLFYDVYNGTERNTAYLRRGVQSIHFQIRTSGQTKGDKGPNQSEGTRKKVLPLDMIFKLIHCSKDIPFIKFNPGNRRENLYRLYYEKMTPDGKKIPTLTPKQIYKLSRETGRSNQISMYLQSQHSSRHPVFLNFDQTGDISVRCTLAKPLSRVELDAFFRELLNPILSTLNIDFRQTGYSISLFQSLSDSNVNVLSMKYVAGARIERDVVIDKINCIYSLLTVNTVRKSEDPIVRYKRVENYKEMDAETALITELYNTMRFTEMTGLELTETVAKRFGMTEERAQARIVECLRDAHEYDGAIIEHPGFPMKIEIANLDNVLEFEVDSIDSIRYIEPLEIYIESILKMTQEIKPRSDLGNHIRDICSRSTRASERRVVEEVVVSAPSIAMKPFMVSNTEDIDIFQELGLTDEYDEKTVDVSEYDEDEYIDEQETDASALLSDLYKNVGVSQEEAPAPEVENPQPEVEAPAPVVQEPQPEAEAPAPEVEAVEPPQEESKSLFGSILSSILPTVTTSPESPPAGEETKETEETKEPESPEETVESEDESDSEKGVFFDSDDESDDEGSTRGGGKPIRGDPRGGVNPSVVDIDDARIRPKDRSLTHPNPFLRKLQSHEPTLFLSKPQGKKYKSYSASCQPTSRQPVILTDEEKTRIDREYPGSYKNAIKYGTDPKNPYWYICPRYWCFLTNSSISEKDVKDGKCGNIIPDNATTIPKGAYVYEFKGDEHTDVNGKYIEHHPGFLKEGKHPDGYCLPCCFKNWDKVGQPLRRQQCAQQTADAISSDNVSDDNTVSDTAVAETVVPDASTKGNPRVVSQKQPPKSALYVISLDTYPVPHTRWGFAPISVQLLLNVDYQKVVDKNNSAIIMPNTPTFLRYGVEQHEEQSFLGVFADIYAYQQRQLAIPTISEFKQILSQQITLDVFVKVHNSSLASAFRPTRPKAKATTEATAEGIPPKYAQSEFAKRLDITKPEQLDFLKDTIASYENFIAYITHPVEPIDHTYLWDIFTSDIPGLNRTGVNLVLLEIMENDVTDNIQLICPTNSFSKYAYDPRKDTVFVLKHDKIYEPIYLYEFIKTPQRVGITSQRTFPSKTLHKNIQMLLTNIEKTSSKYCAPLPSLPRVYEFSEPITLDELIEQIHTRDYIPIAQIVNYRNKVIGVTVRLDVHHTKPEVMVPCFPSAPSTKFKNPVPIKSMDDDTVWKDYTTTRDTLTKIYQESEHKIPCLPKVKVMEDELVVGFLTATNQFVQVMPPFAEQIDDGIPVHQSVNPNVADATITTTQMADTTRVETMTRIRLENQFYIAFRNTVRDLLNNYVYKENRSALSSIIESQKYLYPQKLSQLEKELRTLVSNKVVFVDIDMDVLLELNEIVECNPDAKESPYCLIKENGVQQLSIPKTNLLSKTQDNESMYYIRMADELLRNNRVRLFMFEPETYFNLVDIRYKIHADEFILSQTALLSDYFDNMSVFNATDYVKHTNYDNAMPSVSQTYTNDMITVREQYAEPIHEEESIECIDSIIGIVGSVRSMWKRSFPTTATEIVYKDSVACSFFVLISILKTHTKIDHTILQIKEKLWNGYSRIVDKQPEYLVKIVGILRRQGKKTLMDPVVNRAQTLESLIFSEEYYISDMDIWVMAQTYQLPVILFSPNGLKGFPLKLEWLKCSGRPTDKYSFVRSMIRMDKPNSVSGYHLLQPTFALSELREFYAISTQALHGNPEYSRNIQTIEETLNNMELIAK